MNRLSTAARIVSEASLAVVAVALGLELAIRATPPADLSRAEARSHLVTSKSGEILWGFLAQDQKWRLTVKQGDVDATYLEVLIAYEDKRFRQHRGVDLIALARAGYQALRHTSVVSGGSTLTMQLVRMLEPRPRTLAAKIDQFLKAIKLERTLGKDEILDLYLTLAPFGGNIEGVRAASLIYLGKDPKRLSLAEAALLTAIPQSPEARRPDRHLAAARAARDRVLTTLAARESINRSSAQRATHESLSLSGRTLTRSAPHIATRLRAADPTREAISTLIDGSLQVQVEQIAMRAIARWGDAINIGVIVIRNDDASVAAYLGGVDFFDRNRNGFVDLVQGVRSPGSALKPLIYAMAFETLIVHPETIITDQAIEIAGYRPENADGQFSGDISVRQALIRSRNTTAVLLLDRLGVDNFLARFRSAGRPLYLSKADSDAGLAVALGGVGVTLEQLTWFYSALASEGVLKRLRYVQSDAIQSLGRLVSPPAARATADILADVPAPAGYARQRSADHGRRIGYKTGTSYGFRDAWAIGFDKLHTVGVWIGRPDGAPHLGAYGVTAAAPILMDIFDRLPIPKHDAGWGQADIGALSSLRDLPNRLARFDARGSGTETRPLEITFPRNGTTIRTARPDGASIDLPVSATGGRPPYRWSFSHDVQPASPSPTGRWSTSGRGQHEISIMDATGAIARSSFWLD
jgi:penicillin-binding protein 1C